MRIYDFDVTPEYAKIPANRHRPSAGLPFFMIKNAHGLPLNDKGIALDTLILLLILFTFFAMRWRKRWFVYLPFFVSLMATFLLFLCHATDSLKLNF
ncbi:hypothetical protein GmarT_05370 [Gimesia maris]|uniref:Uncharacterized protein n=2 Tax=Gimesia maris TaxID=122 RepID=A0ABX5YGI2_9PLAN|nr:hypothetical protein Mal35_05510 [Gimesia maris]QEG14701.1 hypothetical protein GmarT_05370 [Gimesia maris]|tara:strand:- start:202080 stop:202370 length:291 start_codon:yes stop_codon:yes gene_type:complete